MKKEPIYVAFSTQKGGVGKSAFTVLTASYLHYTKGYNVAIIDCDYPQYSVHSLREREREQIKNDEFYRQLVVNHFATLRKKSYPIICSKAESAIALAKQFVSEQVGEYDILLFDLPGTVNTKGVIETLSCVDYIFTPIIADRFVLESSLTFASKLNEAIVMNRSNRLKGIHLFWNLVDNREKTDLYSIYEEGINSLGLSVLKTTIPDSKRFRKEMSLNRRIPFRSSLLPADKRSLRGSNIKELITEICDIIKLEGYDEQG
ncbi:MAG: ParA family protein [Bacteroidales bacterium]